MVSLEGQGVPGVFVASAEFVVAAESQSKGLGMAPEAVFVEHPIQDRTDAEMVAIADKAYDEVVAKLLGAA
jgi:hypothetical protein